MLKKIADLEKMVDRFCNDELPSWNFFLLDFFTK
jgi:hypothetical protein